MRYNIMAFIMKKTNYFKLVSLFMKKKPNLRFLATFINHFVSYCAFGVSLLHLFTEENVYTEIVFNY